MSTARWFGHVTLLATLAGAGACSGTASSNGSAAPEGAEAAAVRAARAAQNRAIAAFDTAAVAAYLGRADGPTRVAGRYSAQWVKRDGKWLIRGEVYVALTCADVGCASKAVP